MTKLKILPFITFIFLSLFSINLYALGPGNEALQINAYCSSLDNKNRIACWQMYKSDTNKNTLRVIKNTYDFAKIVRKQNIAKVVSKVIPKIIGRVFGFTVSIHEPSDVSCASDDYCVTSPVYKKLRNIDDKLHKVIKKQSNCLSNPALGSSCVRSFSEGSFLVSQALPTCKRFNDPVLKDACIKNYTTKQNFLNKVNSTLNKEKTVEFTQRNVERKIVKPNSSFQGRWVGTEKNIFGSSRTVTANITVSYGTISGIWNDSNGSTKMSGRVTGKNDAIVKLIGSGGPSVPFKLIDNNMIKYTFVPFGGGTLMKQ